MTTTDNALEQRVRKCLRLVLPRPWHLSVSARNGDVQLSGALLPEDLPRVLAAVSQLSGVRRVEHHLWHGLSVESHR